jgi:hypothetical protein
LFSQFGAASFWFMAALAALALPIVLALSRDLNASVTS